MNGIAWFSCDSTAFLFYVVIDFIFCVLIIYLHIFICLFIFTFQTSGIFGDSVHRESVRQQKDEVKAQHARIIDDLAQRHRREMDTELHIIRRRYMLHEIELERKQLEEVRISV